MCVYMYVIYLNLLFDIFVASIFNFFNLVVPITDDSQHVKKLQ